jgi:DNA polymerase delta subunit 1
MQRYAYLVPIAMTRPLQEGEDFLAPHDAQLSWHRPTPPPWAQLGDLSTLGNGGPPDLRFGLAFQQYDIDYTILPFPLEGMNVGVKAGPCPVIRMYGFTQDGYSVCAKIHGVLPYIFLPAPAAFKESDCEEIRKFLNRTLEAQISNQGKVPVYCLSVESVQRSSIYGYAPKHSTFLKVTLASPKHVPTLRSLLEMGVKLMPTYPHQQFVTYESNLPFVLRFMVDRDIVGGNWITLAAGTYTPSKNPVSRAQLEIDAPFTAVRSHACEGEFSRLGPVRVLSFDIECCGRKGHFPEPEHDPVIQIANIVTVQGICKPIVRNVFVLNGCSPIVGADVRSFASESAMLEAWRQFVVEVDPDIITGYNLVNFDVPYLLNRAKQLKVCLSHFLV